uniref:T-cell receptor T3 zeta chain n=1 Tax=Myripristis murdjan TaxID=586833 RepID=A0A667YQT9_9TELE
MAIKHWIDAMNMYDPKLCYVLDGFLALYGFIITGMLIKEKVSLDARMLTDLRGQDSGGYAPLKTDPERGRCSSVFSSVLLGFLSPCLRCSVVLMLMLFSCVLQGLSHATKDTYDSLQMQPLPSR